MGIPGPGYPTYIQRLGGRDIERQDCPRALETPAHRSLLRLYEHYRAGRVIYPSILEYPHRLLSQLEALDREIPALEAQRAAARKGGGCG